MKTSFAAIATFAAVATLFLCFPQPVRAGEPHPLFADEDMIRVTIEAPFNRLIRNAQTSTAPYDATLTYLGAAPETHAIKLSARGKSRRTRDLCNFPPLRIEFAEKPGDASFFDGQKRLKLVTHCKGSSRYQQYYLLEYTAYRLLNEITPFSLRVRLAEIDYVEAKSGKVKISRVGFLIEDTDDAAKRNDYVEIDTPDISKDQLDRRHAARYAVFQYMIGNLDWSMHSGPKNDDCCHNTKLLGASDEARNDLVPVPYDFDYSGFVNTPYAAPPEQADVPNVRKRLYRGFCMHNDEALAAIAEIRQKRVALTAVIAETPALKDATRRTARRYLDGFFDDIETDEKAQKRLLRRCRN